MVLGTLIGRYTGMLGRYMRGEGILARYLGRYKRWVG